MNTLTQQQINQYQWQAADGVARIVNPYKCENMGAYKCYELPECPWCQGCIGEDEFEKSIGKEVYHTNAPDGIYSGEAFEVIEQISIESHSGWFELLLDEDLTEAMQRIIGTDSYKCDTRLFLFLKPSHLPAVLTTQPGEEWKDRYREVWLTRTETSDWEPCKTQPGGKHNFKSFSNVLWETNIDLKREWHLIKDDVKHAEDWYCPKCKAYLCGEQVTFEETHQTCGTEVTIGKPADQEEHTQLNTQYLLQTIASMTEYKNNILDQLETLEKKNLNLQSILTPKDQRIAELEQMLDQCQKGDLYFEQEKEHLNKKIAELEREREWISVEDRLPNETGNLMGSMGNDVHVYRFNSNNQTFSCWPVADAKVTHWMPLPTPSQH